MENVKIEGKQEVACKLRAHDKHGNQDGYLEDNQSGDPGKAVEKIDNNLKKPVKIVKGMICGNIGKGICQGYLEIFKDQLAGL